MLTKIKQFCIIQMKGEKDMKHKDIKKELKKKIKQNFKFEKDIRKKLLKLIQYQKVVESGGIVIFQGKK